MRFCFVILTLSSLLNNVISVKKEHLLSDKLDKLIEWSGRKSVIRFSGEKFRQYCRMQPRNYSMVVMFTALSAARGCQVCSAASDEFHIVSNSWRFSPQFHPRLFFALVDFDEATDVFQQLGMNSVPVFMHFPAKSKPRRIDTMDMSRTGFQAEALARWIEEVSDTRIRVFRPPDYSASLALVLLFLVLGGFLYLKRDNLDFIYNKTAWGFLCLSIIFCFLSGQMWNHIRGPPMLHRNPQNGQISYLWPGNGGQYILESYFIMLLYIAITIGFIGLHEISNQELEPKKKKVYVIGGLVMVAFFFSLLLAVFRSKYQGYPYSFLI